MTELPRSSKQLAQLLWRCLHRELSTGTIRAGESGIAVQQPQFTASKREYVIYVVHYAPDTKWLGRSVVEWRAAMDIDSKMQVRVRHGKDVPANIVDRMLLIAAGACEV